MRFTPCADAPTTLAALLCSPTGMPKVKPSDPVSLLVPALVLLAGSILAALPPVLRASRTDPVQTLRAD